MRARCNNPKDKSYKYYGGRGIVVCSRWDSFESFLFDMGKRPVNDMWLDRRETNGNYEPGNCRWVTATTQQNNRRNNRRFTISGKSKTVSEWARSAGVHVQTVLTRLKSGKSIVQALKINL